MFKVGDYEYDNDAAHVLGRGTQGSVFQGNHRITGDLVAIKVAHKKAKYTKQELQILRKVSRLKSLHIVALLYHEESQIDGCLYFVTEFCNYGNLQKYLQEESVDDRTAQDMMHQFASGLHVLYKNKIVHRDLKPENILLHVNHSTQKFVLKITDLGVAKVLEAGGDTASLVGTLIYMAPEIALRSRYDFKVDLWSFGVIAEQCYRGLHTHPVQNVTKHSSNEVQLGDFFRDSDIHISLDGLPSTLADLLKRVLIINPRSRIGPREFFQHGYFQEQFSDDSDDERTCSRTSGYASALDDSRSTIKSSLASLRMDSDDRPTDGASTFAFRPSSLRKSRHEVLTNDIQQPPQSQSQTLVSSRPCSASPVSIRPSFARKKRQDNTAYDNDIPLQPYPPQLDNVSPAQNSISAPRPELPSERRLKHELNHYIDHNEVRELGTKRKFIYKAYGDDKTRNEARYNVFGEVIQEYIYDKLEAKGMSKICVPMEIDSTGLADQRRSFVFATSKIKHGRNTKKLLIFIQGSGIVRAGMWSRKLCLNDSLDKGSMLPMVKIAKAKGYDIIILNPNLNKTTVNGVDMPIPQNRTAEEHATYVWKELISPCNPQFIAIVAHSAGGLVVNHLMDNLAKEFLQRVKAVAMTDPCQITQANKNLLGERYREWVRSKEARGTILSADTRQPTLDGAAGQTPTVISTGTLVHEETTFMATGQIFEFLEERFEKLYRSP